MRKIIFIIAILQATTVHANDLKSDPLLAKVYTEAQPYEHTTFPAKLHWTAVSKEGKAERIISYDPAKPTGQRWHYILRNGKPPEAKQVKSLTESFETEILEGYSIAADFLRDKWTLTSNTDTAAVYTLIPDDNSKVIVQDINMVKFLKTQMVIEKGDKPYIKSLTMTSLAPFSPKLGAKVKSLDMQYFFDRRAGGDIVEVKETLKVDAKYFIISLTTDDTKVLEDVGKRVAVPGKAAK